MKNKSKSQANASRARTRGNNNNNNSASNQKNMGSITMSNPVRGQFSRSHMVVPPVFKTTLGIDFFGYYSSTLNKVTVGVSANSLHVPFNSALVATNSYHIAASPYTGSVYTTMQPQGFSNLCGSAAPYLNYRVLGSRIKFKLIPLALADSTVATINQVSTGEQWNTSVWTGAEGPYASRTAVFSASEPDRSITQHFSSAEAFGVPDIAIKDDLVYAGSFNTSPETEWNWIINIQSVSTNTTEPIGVFIEVEYDAEFFNPATGGLNDI
jgi:hypothetical protein